MVMAIGGPLVGYVIAARGKARVAREGDIAERSEFRTKLDNLSEAVKDLRDDNRELFRQGRLQVAERAEFNASLSRENKVAIIETRDAATEAVAVGKDVAQKTAVAIDLSNHTNDKLEKLGLSLQTKRAAEAPDA